MAAGCKSPWGGKISDTVPGVTPPPERIKTLVTLTDNALKAGPAQQEELAARLLARYPKERDPLVRGEIVRNIGRLSGASSSALLYQATKDSDADVRVSACKMLGNPHHKSPETTRILAEMVTSDVDIDVRLASADSLGRVGDASAVKPLGLALDDHDPAMQFRVVAALRKIAPQQDLGNDVERWRAYAKGEPVPPAKTISVAEQVQSWFH
jgi:HEAT repeat protein